MSQARFYCRCGRSAAYLTDNAVALCDGCAAALRLERAAQGGVSLVRLERGEGAEVAA